MSSTRRGLLRGLLVGEPLRPPGARSEPEFAALCIRCGRCVEICPYGTPQPAGWSSGLDAGTPVVRPRQVPCYLCLLCPPECPTGALEPVSEMRQVRMGVARVDTESCYAHRGVLCRTCLDECPLEGEAILQDGQLQPVVTEKCVGCGLCERFCPVDSPAITVVPSSRAETVTGYPFPGEVGRSLERDEIALSRLARGAGK